MCKQLISESYTIFVNSISSIRVVEATNNDTHKIEYLVIAILNSYNVNGVGIDFSHPGVLILSEAYSDITGAKNFKAELDRRIKCSDEIFLEDITEYLDYYEKGDK